MDHRSMTGRGRERERLARGSKKRGMSMVGTSRAHPTALPRHHVASGRSDSTTMSAPPRALAPPASASTSAPRAPWWWRDRGRYLVASFDAAVRSLDYLLGVAAHADGRWWFGEQARARMAGAQSAARGPRPRSSGWCRTRRPTTRSRVRRAPRPRSTCSRAYPGWVRQMLATRSNLELPDDPSVPIPAMVAVPANASTRQRCLTLEAFRRAGFVQGQVNEPTAAVIEYAHREPTACRRAAPSATWWSTTSAGHVRHRGGVARGAPLDLLTSEVIGGWAGPISTR